MDLVGHVNLPPPKRKESEAGEGERDRSRRGGRRLGGRRRGPARERERKAHFLDFKAKDNSVLIIHSLRIISVTLPFAD